MGKLVLSLAGCVRMTVLMYVCVLEGHTAWQMSEEEQTDIRRKRKR